MVKVVKSTTRIVEHPGFDAFLKAYGNIIYPDVQNIISHSVEYETIKGMISKKIVDDFNESQKFVNTNYEHCRPIQADTNTWNQGNWEKDV